MRKLIHILLLLIMGAMLFSCAAPRVITETVTIKEIVPVRDTIIIAPDTVKIEIIDKTDSILNGATAKVDSLENLVDSLQITKDESKKLKATINGLKKDLKAANELIDSLKASVNKPDSIVYAKDIEVEKTSTTNTYVPKPVNPWYNQTGWKIILILVLVAIILLIIKWRGR